MGGDRSRQTERAALPAAPQALARPSSSTTPAPAILPTLLEPLRRGDGIRIGWLGNTGQGKTYATAWLLDELHRGNLIDVGLIVDDKDARTVFAGAQRTNPDDLKIRPPGEDEDQRAVVYRGVRLDPEETIEVEAAAEQAWELSAQGARVALVVDELRRAVSPAGREWRAPTVARSLTEGRGARISVIWSTQAPQRIPVEAYDQSTLAIFKLGHRGRAYLERADLISDAASLVIAGLEPRQFVLVDDAGDWDGRVYEVPLRRV